jgi:hypothetical protein
MVFVRCSLSLFARCGEGRVECVCAVVCIKPSVLSFFWMIHSIILPTVQNHASVISFFTLPTQMISWRSGFTALLTLLVSTCSSNAILLRVCQNKDCCRRFQGRSTLPEVIQDLLTPAASEQVTVQVSGCLSQCDKGPNLCLGEDNSINGVIDASEALFQLQTACEVKVPPKLYAAVTVLEKGLKGKRK